jgi:hypothetical protein
VGRNRGRLLRACLAWCTEQPQYSAIPPTVNPAGAQHRAPFEEWLQDLRDRKGRAVIRARLERVRAGNFGD